MKISNFLFTISLLVITIFSNAQQIAIIPEPFQMKVGNGSYTLPKIIAINAPSSANEISELIVNKLKAVTSSQVTKSSTKSNIDIQISNETELGKEGYHLDVNEKGIQIKANTNAGLFYAWQSLLQIMPTAIFNNTIQNNLAGKFLMYPLPTNLDLVGED